MGRLLLLLIRICLKSLSGKILSVVYTGVDDGREALIVDGLASTSASDVPSLYIAALLRHFSLKKLLIFENVKYRTLKVERIFQ